MVNTEACRRAERYYENIPEIIAEKEAEMGTTHISLANEEKEQEVVMQWARMHTGRWSELGLLYHCPNGGSRNKREGARLKRMGVLAGVPDLHLPVSRNGYHSLYIEMKYKDGRLSPTQKDIIDKLASEKNCCLVCYTAEDAIKALEMYLTFTEESYKSRSIIKNGKIIGEVR